MQEIIRQQIADNPVLIYIKGSAEEPLCGFSARALGVLRDCGVPFKAINVLDDPALRQGIKDYSNWPTVPQIYIHGEFIGGSDILAEMYESGELQELLASNSK